MRMKISINIFCYLWFLACLGACSDKDSDNAIEPSCSISADGKEGTRINVEQSASTLTVSIESNLAWTLKSDAEWCRVSAIAGVATTVGNPKKMEITVDRNLQESSRTAKLRLTAGTASAELEIVQAAFVPVDETEWETATTAVYNMHVGWNLGNTLDSYGTGIASGSAPSVYETAWGQPVTTPAMIRKFKEAGFNAIRVPVTWEPHMDANNMVEEVWMKRVEEVVNYVLDADMYCILNVHHDTGTNGWIRADWNSYPATGVRFKKLWEQIAARFQKYDKHLLFESYNEMLDLNNDWNGTSADGYKALNALAQDFVDVVRQSGGNNLLRNLVVNTYCAGTGASMLDSFVLPTDVVEDRLLAEVHAYIPYSFALDEESPVVTFTGEGEKEIDEIMSRLNERFCKRNIPVILGECGAVDKNNMAERVKQAAYTVRAAKQYGIVCFRWMGLLDRSTLEWSEPEIVEAIIQNAK